MVAIRIIHFIYYLGSSTLNSKVDTSQDTELNFHYYNKYARDIISVQNTFWQEPEEISIAGETLIVTVSIIFFKYLVIKTLFHMNHYFFTVHRPSHICISI